MSFFCGGRCCALFALFFCQTLQSVQLSASTLSIAHRGNSSAAPENTLPAFALARGFADVVEIDVQPTLDGQWVLMHDTTVNRTTNGSGSVSSLTYAQIQALDAGAWFSPQYAGLHVPTMAEAIGSILSGGMIPLIEPKTGPVDQLVRALQEQGVTSKVIVHSYDWPLLGEIHALDSSIRLGALGTGNVTDEKLDQIQASGATIANWTKSNTIPVFLDKVHARGMQMWSYVVNDTPTIESLVAMGVDGIGTDYPALVTQATQPASIVGRYIFYNNSVFDGQDPNAGSNDKNAIALDKSPLTPGKSANFSHYTSYAKGINGIILDVQNFSGVPTLADFRFRVGNSDDSAQWTEAPAPSNISFRPSEGPGQTDRITLIWPDGAIKNEWLEVSLLPTLTTGLVTADTFYFGNAVGEAGNFEDEARVSILDELLARNNPRSISNLAPITFPYDYDRDGRVSIIDQLLARNNLTANETSLRLISPGTTLPPAALLTVPEPDSLVLAAVGSGTSAILCWRRRQRLE
jgi:glycerophosphoryl diester phosphodiesterase